MYSRRQIKYIGYPREDGNYFIRFYPEIDKPGSDRLVNVFGRMILMEGARFYVNIEDILSEDDAWIRCGEDVRKTDYLNRYSKREVEPEWFTTFKSYAKTDDVPSLASLVQEYKHLEEQSDKVCCKGLAGLAIIAVIVLVAWITYPAGVFG